MKVTKLVHDKVNARVVSEDDSINAFYTTDNENKDNDCPDEVVDEVVKMFNEGKTLIEIDEYLLDAECTQDAREIMVEGLFFCYNPTKKKFKVQVVRRYYTCVTIDVEAFTPSEAKQIAEEESGNIEGSMQFEDIDEPFIILE